MPDSSANLALPYILPAQAQKHVTHNEAIQRLDVLVQAVVQNRTLTIPPEAPSEGQCHIVAQNASGDWTGQDGRLAVFIPPGWDFIAPRLGWQVYVLDEDGVATFTTTGWVTLAEQGLTVAELGVNATPDAVNRLVVSSQATLLSHEGGGHQLKINKAGLADTASLLFQTNWSGRAEMGLAGSDDFSIKVSPDGSAFTEALAINRISALVRMAHGLDVTGAIVGTAVTQSATDTTAGRVLKVGDYGLGTASLFTGNLDTLNVNGLYRIGTGATSPSSTNVGIGLGQYVLHLNWDANAAHQTLHVQVSGIPRMFYRVKSGGTWSLWREVFNAGSILGTVSQTGGVPTGRVIERGSNANGDYVRFADGTQICTFSGPAVDTTVALGSMFQNTNALTWTFPAAFVANPTVSGSGGVTSRWLGLNVPSTTSVAYRVLSAITNTSAIAHNLMAVGRWF